MATASVRRPLGLESPRALATRLFLTCWIVYVLHFASNTVREIYPALVLGDHFSFRVDEYAGMHPDLFETPGYGWHIGNNPGVSMLAAIPYAMARPLIDPLVAHVRRQRAESGLTEPPSYDSPWPMAREFYRESWRRGYDVKFGLAALVMQALCMAPSSALGVIVVFHILRQLLGSSRAALWMSLLYAFGTPVFFRTGFLNHNLMLGHIALMGFVAMWNPSGAKWGSTPLRYFLGGLAGGTALLFDYSGAVLLLGLFGYGIAKRLSVATPADAMRHGGWYILGTLAPVALLWFYQWRSFGHPLYPGQHWMPPETPLSDRGRYQGYGEPQLDLLWMLAFDHRFGFFVSSPLLLLGPVCLLHRAARRLIGRLELLAMLGFFVGFWVFFAGSNYTRLQDNTGVRYMAPMFPFLFIPAALVLAQLPRMAVYFIGVASVFQSWCLAMYREVEHSLGVLNPILHVFLDGFKLPLLTVLSRMQSYREFFEHGPSPLPLFVLTAAILYGIWAPHLRRSRIPIA